MFKWVSGKIRCAFVKDPTASSGENRVKWRPVYCPCRAGRGSCNRAKGGRAAGAGRPAGYTQWVRLSGADRLPRFGHRCRGRLPGMCLSQLESCATFAQAETTGRRTRGGGGDRSWGQFGTSQIQAILEEFGRERSSSSLEENMGRSF